MRLKILTGSIVVSIIVALFLGNIIIQTNEKGYFEIKQEAMTGVLSAKMTPGMYCQCFGDIQRWPNAETFYFTADSSEGGSSDDSVEVRFYDGSLANISGSLRLDLPRAEELAINLVSKHSYKNYNDFSAKLIKTHVRNVLRLTANLMTARESYSIKRGDFRSFAEDQMHNGLYETVDFEVVKVDLLTGKKVKKTIKKPKIVNGIQHYQKNPLEGLGIVISNFDIKKFKYDPKVKIQIEKQQEALMGIETSIAKAKEADQLAKTKKAEGLAAVAEAKYKEEVIKIKAVVKAEQREEVAAVAKREAIINAEAHKDVAELKKDEALFYKQEQISRGEGEAARKKAVMLADGALSLKLKTYENVMISVAKDFSKQKWTPEIVMGGGKNIGGVVEFMDVLMAKTAKDLALDMKLKK